MDLSAAGSRPGSGIKFEDGSDRKITYFSHHLTIRP